MHDLITHADSACAPTVLYSRWRILRTHILKRASKFSFAFTNLNATCKQFCCNYTPIVSVHVCVRACWLVCPTRTRQEENALCLYLRLKKDTNWAFAIVDRLHSQRFFRPLCNNSNGSLTPGWTLHSESQRPFVGLFNLTDILEWLSFFFFKLISLRTPFVSTPLLV